MDCKQYQQYTLNEANDENSKKTKEWIDVSVLYLFSENDLDWDNWY